MNVPRFLPAVHVLGRTIACNRSDIVQHSARIYNQSTNSLVSQPSISGTSLPNSNFDDRLRLQQNLLHTGRGSYLKVVSRSFSTGVQFFCREFKDGENEHAHDILCSLPAYKASTINMKLNSVNYVNTFASWSYKEKFWPAVDTDELVHTFMSVSKVLFMYNSPAESHQQYNNLFNCIITRIPYMTDEQLLVILSALCYWPHAFCHNSPKYDTIWKTLDICCSRRIKKWDTSQIYLVAEHWYALRITKVSMFFDTLVRHFGRNVLNLSPTQFVQFMFYANLNRDLVVNHFELNRKLKEVLSSISVEELGIVAMALFKTKTFFVDISVLEDIITRTEKNLDKISDHSLGSILKFLGKAFPGDAHKLCYKFLDSLNTYLPRFNHYVLLKAVTMGNNLLVFHENLFHRVTCHVANEMSSLRLKDIERFTYTLMLYQYIPPECPNILSLIVEELRRPERIVEINHFPRSFSSCVNFLVAMEVFPHDLISAALQPSMIQVFRDDVHDKNDQTYGRELHEIDRCISIELPSTYLGYRLSPEMRKLFTERFIGKIATSSTKGITHQERFTLDVQAKLSSMIGCGGNVEQAIILPHFSHPDLIFCTTRDGDPVKLPEEFNDLSFTDLKPASKFDHLGLSWNAVMIGGRNSIVRGSDELKGNLLMKKRQLVKLGYNVSVVPYTGYTRSSLKYKLQFLEKCLKISTLNLEGRREVAFASLKAVDIQQNSNEKDVKVESPSNPLVENVACLSHG